MRISWILVVVAVGGCAHSVDRDLVQAGLHEGSFTRRVAPSDSLVVASYNIKFAEKVEQAIVDLRADPWTRAADILLLQEMDPEGTERIADELGYDFVYYPASIHPRHDKPFGNAVLVRGTIDSHEFIPLPEGGIFPVTSRIAVAARVRSRGGPMMVVSAHTSTMMVPPETRLEQSEEIRDRLAAVEVPVLIGGDFNSVSREDVIDLRDQLAAAGLRQAHLPKGPTARSRGLILRWVDDVDMVLDHLFYRDLELRRAGIVTEALASDHYPIWAVFELPAAP